MGNRWAVERQASQFCIVRLNIEDVLRTLEVTGRRQNGEVSFTPIFAGNWALHLCASLVSFNLVRKSKSNFLGK